jgi:hypothetical protein
LENAIAAAKNSLKAGISIDVITEITGLSVDEIKQLQKGFAQRAANLFSWLSTVTPHQQVSGLSFVPPVVSGNWLTD